MNTNDIILRKAGALGRITLNRPKALNTLTWDMCAAMLGGLRDWANDPAIQTVLIDAPPGRAFCAGGDIRAIAESAQNDDGRAAEFFTTEYRLNAAIRHFPKPYVALIDGIAFGGALGVTVHGSHRIVAENASLAMPETAIGLFPDIGASYFLPRLPGKIGMYLALTGLRLNAAESLYAGLATDFVPAARFPDIVMHLVQGESPDAVLARHASDPGPASIAEHRAVIDRTFAAASVEEIVRGLRNEGGWGREIADLLETRCPDSLEITFRLMREGAVHDLEDCLRLEYRIMTRLVKSHNFATGVRAALIDKNPQPEWRPAKLGAVNTEEISHYFASLDADEIML